MGWLEDPYTEHYALEQVERQRARVRRFQAMATEQVAADIAYGASVNPTANPALIVGAVMNGMPTDDENFLAAVELEQQQTAETAPKPVGFFGKIGDVIRGGVRWLALGFEGVYDEIINRPLRTAANMVGRGMDLGQAYAASGDAPFSAFGEALGQINPFQEGGSRELNIGHGWLPQSQLAKPVEEALAQLQQSARIVGAGESAERDQIYKFYEDNYGFAPLTFLPDAQQQMMLQSQMENRIMEMASDPSNEQFGQAQSLYGAPIVERQRAEKNSVYIDMQTPLQSGPNYQQVSVGRVFAGLITESGTKPFHYVSGALDFLSNIVLDPTNAVGAGVAKLAKARTALNIGDAGKAALAGADEAAIEVSKLIDEVDGLNKDSVVRHFGDWTPETQQKALSLADRGITPEMVEQGLESAVRFKYQEVGRKVLAKQRAEARLAELVNDPDFVRVQGYADSTRDKFSMWDTLTKAEREGKLVANQKVETAYRRHLRAQMVTDEMGRLRSSADELAAADEVVTFNRWADSTKERALRLAEEADIDPAVNRNLANQQRIARAYKVKSAEIASVQAKADELAKTATISHQVRGQAGILNGTRKDIDSKKVTEFIGGKNAEQFVDALAQADAVGVDDILGHIKTTVPRAVREDLANATTRIEVIETLLPEMTKGGELLNTASRGAMRRAVSQLDTPMTRMTAAINHRMSRLSNTIERKPLWAGGRLHRMFGEMSPRSIDLNDLDRSYEKLIHFAENVGWQRGDEALEANLKAFRGLTEGNYTEAFEMLNKFQTDAINHLTVNGLQDNVRSALTNWISGNRQEAFYWIDEAGRKMDDNILWIDGHAVPGNGQPHMMSETFKGVLHMPDPQLVRRAAAEFDRLGSLMNRLATAGSDKLFDPRPWNRITNKYMTHLWKPLTLIRVAWPVRVIAEEQARMMAAGISQPLRHPIHTIGRIFYRSDLTDIKGGMMQADEVYQKAMARRISFQGDFRDYSTPKWRMLRRGEVPHSHYRDGLLSEWNQLWTDDIVAQLFRKGDDAENLAHADRVDFVVDWLRNSDEGQVVMDDLFRNASSEAHRAIESDDALRGYVESVYARAHQKAGGRWELWMPDGEVRNMDNVSGRRVRLGEGEVPPTRPTYVVVEPGIDELVDSFGTRIWREMNVGKYFNETAADIKLRPNNPSIKDVRREVDALLNSRAGERLPSWVKGSMAPSRSEISQWDSTVNTLFDWLMSRPTNRLSRSPAFREYYWRAAGELAPYMDEATLKAARKGADNAGKASRRIFDEAAGERALLAPDQPRGLTNLAHVDEVAKSKALVQVQDLLFDVSKRSNFADAASIVMPFADAWVEVMTSWGKIIRQENVRPFRRLQQLVQGARESNITDPASGYSNEGFFREKDGREVFTIPFVNDLWQKMSGFKGDFEMSPSQLSIATDILPALGPVAQFVAQPIIPDEPGWDWLRGYTSPLGERGPARTFIPAYMQRVLMAMDWSRNMVTDPEMHRLYNTSVADVLNQMARDDPDFFEQNRDNPEVLLREARSKASQLWWVRALATFMGPAAPSVVPTVEDKDGFAWQSAVLQDDYYKILESHKGDTIAATEEFTGKYGIEPFTLTTSKTAEIHQRSATTIGNNFQRTNPELFEKYPDIAYYLGPSHLEDHAPFDWSAYHDQLAEGAREPLSPEQFLAMINDSKGRLIYAKEVAEIEENFGRRLSDPGWPEEVKDQLEDQLRTLDAQLIRVYTGYAGAGFGSEVPGMPARIDTNQQIQQVRKAIMQNPDLVAANPALNAAAQYLQLYDEAAAVANLAGPGELATSGQGDPTNPAYQLRHILRTAAADLIQSHPEFGPMWENIFGRELVDDLDQEMTIEDAWTFSFGDGD